MKIAISCDALVERNNAVRVVESLLSLYEDAEIYCLLHHAGNILGPIEQRRIHSTSLSHLLKDSSYFGDEFWKKSMLVPGLAKNLTVPCSVDLLINVSSGFSQGISHCEGVYQITYLIENQFKLRKPKFLREKLFRTYLENWAEKAVLSSNEIWVQNEKSLNYWQDKHQQVSLLEPFYKASDFPLFPEGARKAFPNDFFSLDAESMSPELAKDLSQLFEEKGIKFKFVGEDNHLAELRDSNPKLFFGDRCSGELAPFLAASRGLLSFANGFSSMCVQCLSTGTPIWLPETSEGHQYFKGPGVYGKESFSTFRDDPSALFNEMATPDPKKVHGQTTRFHDLKFRSEVNRRVQKLDLSKTKENC